VKLGIDVGDLIAIDPQSEFLDNGFICSRHLDDKAGVAVMLAALRACSSEARAARRHVFPIHH
jgi:putative aminopeptidase FrvX